MADIKNRKKQHIDIVLNKTVGPDSSQFTKYSLEHISLPSFNFSQIDTTIEFLDWKIDFPFIISSMSGGEENGRTINENIAKACEATNIPYGLGSMRALLEHPETISTFDVKQFSPSIPMFGNLGMVQLNYGVTYDDIAKLIESTSMNGIFFHINALQEAVQPEGDTNFDGLLDKFARIVGKIEVPIIIKEVGHGLDVKTIKSLKDIGIKWFDVSGVGGTSWAHVEGYRSPEEMTSDNLGYIYKDFGISTTEAIKAANKINGIDLIAGGGLRNGLDLAKSIALGTQLGTAAQPFLKAALESPEEVIKVIKRFKKGLKIAMFMTNSKNVQDLQKINVVKKSN